METVPTLPDDEAAKRSQRTDYLRHQGMEIKELFMQFVAERPEIDLSNDDDLTPEQEEAWHHYSATLLAYHESERLANG